MDGEVSFSGIPQDRKESSFKAHLRVKSHCQIMRNHCTELAGTKENKYNHLKKEQKQHHYLRQKSNMNTDAEVDTIVKNRI